MTNDVGSLYSACIHDGDSIARQAFDRKALVSTRTTTEPTIVKRYTPVAIREMTGLRCPARTVHSHTLNEQNDSP